MNLDSRVLRQIPIHCVNALGICFFVGFMLYWPYYYDRGPPIDWRGLGMAMAQNAVWLCVPVFLLDIVPAFVFSRERDSWQDYFLKPFSSAFIFGVVAEVLFYSGIVAGTLPGEHVTVFSAQNAQQARFLFLLHFIPIFVFESGVRFLWLKTRSPRLAPRAHL